MKTILFSLFTSTLLFANVGDLTCHEITEAKTSYRFTVSGLTLPVPFHQGNLWFGAEPSPRARLNCASTSVARQRCRNASNDLQFYSFPMGSQNTIVGVLESNLPEQAKRTFLCEYDGSAD